MYITPKQKRLRLLVGFAAGFVSVLLLHQGILAFLHSIGFIPFAPYPTQPTQPFEIPQIWSSAFWGGIWGIVLSRVAGQIRQHSRFWIKALLFGMLAPTAVFLFVIMPLKGMPVAGGWQPNLIVTGLMINAAWGVGVAVSLWGLSKLTS